MVEHVIIDGNNLLHTLREHAPIAAVGRETMVRLIERWRKTSGCEVTLIFDGPAPRGGLSKQLSPEGLTVRFSAPATADDLIVAMIRDEKDPTRLRVVTSDKAIRHAAGYRKCRSTDSVSFVSELFPPERASHATRQLPDEKPAEVQPDDAEKWKEAFGGDDEPFDGFEAMLH
jgi:predicted RNA-binding protein with PIN domain